MNNEEKSIVQVLYEKNYSACNKNIVLYGTGIQTKNIVMGVKNHHVVGLMDHKHTGEVIYGVRVLSEEEVKLIPDVTIVIVARAAVINLIYSRIENFTNEYEIPVYDINGRLLKTHLFDISDDCFCLNRKLMLDKIDKSDVISFDIFDTLVCRDVLKPTDVYEIMDAHIGKKNYIFSKERKQAEGELINPTIYEIYERIRINTGESKEQINYLLNMELTIEKKLLRRREDVCCAIKYARKRQQRVILISDMYLTSDIISEMLNDLGIVEYDALYVSCEYNRTKDSGLFEIVREKEKISGQWLHIGDNEFADIASAQKSGIDTYRIYSPSEMLERGLYSLAIDKCITLDERIVLGRFASKNYNSPFGSYEKNGKIAFSDISDVIDTIIAPIIYRFMLWLTVELKKDAIEYVLFPSRDGYILEKIYKYIKEKDEALPECKYLLTSRRAALVAAAKTPEDVEYIAKVDSSDSHVQRVMERFELGGSGEEYVEVDEELIALAIKRAILERKNYSRYLSENGLGNDAKAAIIDFVSSGTVQEALQRIIGKQLFGYYFWRRTADTKEKKELNIRELFGKGNDYQCDSNVYRFYYFIENILSSDKPCFKYIDDENKPVYYKESRTSDEIQLLMVLQEHVIDFCKWMIDTLPISYICRDSVELYETVLGFFSKTYINDSFDEEALFTNIDEFMKKNSFASNR